MHVEPHNITVTRFPLYLVKFSTYLNIYQNTMAFEPMVCRIYSPGLVYHLHLILILSGMSAWKSAVCHGRPYISRPHLYNRNKKRISVKIKGVQCLKDNEQFPVITVPLKRWPRIYTSTLETLGSLRQLWNCYHARKIIHAFHESNFKYNTTPLVCVNYNPYTCDFFRCRLIIFEVSTIR